MHERPPEYGYKNPAASCAHAYLVPSLLKMLGKWGPSDRPCRVLDAGCGNGYVTGILLEAGFDVVGIDASASGIQQARANNPGGTFECLSVYEELKDRLGPFDLIVSTEVIEHLHVPRRFVSNLRAVLKPGGVMLLSTPYHGYLKNLGLAILGKWDGHLTALWDGGHIKFWSRPTLSALLEEQGLEVVDFLGCGRLPYLWKSMILVARKPESQREP